MSMNCDRASNFTIESIQRKRWVEGRATIAEVMGDHGWYYSGRCYQIRLGFGICNLFYPLRGKSSEAAVSRHDEARKQIPSSFQRLVSIKEPKLP